MGADDAPLVNLGMEIARGVAKEDSRWREEVEADGHDFDQVWDQMAAWQASLPPDAVAWFPSN